MPKHILYASCSNLVSEVRDALKRIYPEGLSLFSTNPLHNTPETLVQTAITTQSDAILVERDYDLSKLADLVYYADKINIAVLRPVRTENGFSHIEQVLRVHTETVNLTAPLTAAR